MLLLNLMLLFFNVFLINVSADYLSQRDDLKRFDAQFQIGSDIKLSHNEEKINRFLLDLKQKELDIETLTDVPLSEQNFIIAQDEIRKSNVFQIIQRMPKGAMLHVHDSSMGSYKNLIKKWTYDKRCFMCFNQELQKMKFKISDSKIHGEKGDNCTWRSVPMARLNYSSIEEFDTFLMSFITLTKEDVLMNQGNQDAIWEKFQSIFFTLDGLINYEESFKEYYSDSLQELIDDNVQYVEVRAMLPSLYHLNGTVTAGGIETLKEYIKLEEKFRLTHPDDFYGAKYVYSALRSQNNDVIKAKVLEAIEMRETFPGNFAGFDLVGQEDSGYALLHFINELLLPKKLGKKLQYIFHTGETDRQGDSVDGNLYDAILLNTSRIGHGYAISKHPYLKDETKRRNISIELCPISNQVLGLVSDLRDHPAASLLAEDQPITISPDDPAIWGASGVSYDFYEVLMAMTPADAGLRVLKQLAFNSIRYSSLNDYKKEELMQMWRKKWDKFINEMMLTFQLDECK